MSQLGNIKPQLSPLAKMLSHPQMEGYTNHFVIPSDSSGPTIGGGIDLSKQGRREFEAVGLPSELVDKLVALDFQGKSGSAARAAITAMPQALQPTPDEITMMTNAFVGHTEDQMRGDLPNWDNLPPGPKAIAMSAAHQYGQEGFRGQNLFKQIASEDYEGMHKNLNNWGDKTAGVSDSINSRYARMANMVPGFDGAPPTIKADKEKVMN